MGATSVQLLLVLSLCAYAQAAKILMIPYLNASHFLEFNGLGKPLVARGHEVYVLLDASLTLKSDKYKVIGYKSSPLAMQQLSPENQTKLLSSSKGGLNPDKLFRIIKDVCTNLMQDTDTFDKLKALNFDLVVVDNFLAQCFFLVPYKLGVPFATIGSLVPAWYLRLPVLPSVVEPILGLDAFGVRFCEETPSQLSIVRRTCRLLAFVMQELFTWNLEDDYLRKYVDFPTMVKVRENVSIALINQLNLLSSQLPKLPHVEYVGGITTSPAKPLPEELAEWMSKESNVVVVSFGSRFASLPLEIAEKLMVAFGKLDKYRFLFRFAAIESTRNLHIPDNVHTSSWLPQNDALGHNSTRLFITHSGNNGQLEALYHAVPMLCFYVQGDQKSNAKRVVKRGYGQMLNLFDFTVQDVVDSVEELISNPVYKQKIQRASNIFHSQTPPSERAADAIEHVLKYGADHLRPKEAYKLQWWQFFMLDILAVIYAGALTAIFISYKVLQCILRLVCRRKSSRPDKTKLE